MIVLMGSIFYIIRYLGSLIKKAQAKMRPHRVSDVNLWGLIKFKRWFMKIARHLKDKFKRHSEIPYLHISIIKRGDRFIGGFIPCS